MRRLRLLQKADLADRSLRFIGNEKCLELAGGEVGAKSAVPGGKDDAGRRGGAVGFVDAEDGGVAVLGAFERTQRHGAGLDGEERVGLRLRAGVECFQHDRWWGAELGGVADGAGFLLGVLGMAGSWWAAMGLRRKVRRSSSREAL